MIHHVSNIIQFNLIKYNIDINEIHYLRNFVFTLQFNGNLLIAL